MMLPVEGGHPPISTKSHRPIKPVTNHLNHVKTDLARIMSEKDNLKLELTTVIEARDKLQAMVGQATNIEEQLLGQLHIWYCLGAVPSNL